MSALELEGSAVDPSIWGMPYTKPLYALNQVDKAGEAIARADTKSRDFLAAVPVFYNWREAHAYPQNAFYVTLSRRALKIDAGAVVSQRLKRRGSIMGKLLKNEKMELSQMQDIAGCRAVMPNIQALDRLMTVYSDSPIQSQHVRTTNYINGPRASGYRGIHMMYRFKSRGDDAAAWNKLRVEIQVRTALQHAWATAVEAVDLFTKQNLKGEHGRPEWETFFALVAATHAHQEGTAKIPMVPDLSP